MPGWNEARHFAVEFVGTLLGLGLLWFLVGVLSFLYLFPGGDSLGNRLFGPVLLGEVVAGVLYVVARRSQLRPRHFVHSVRRISRPSRRREVVGRMQEFMEIVRRLMVTRLGPAQYEAFLLKPLYGDPDLPEKEMPET